MAEIIKIYQASLFYLIKRYMQFINVLYFSHLLPYIGMYFKSNKDKFSF